ncbi:hypothetical protein MHYP_G00101060 [Metynnis hypsauchen]
MASALLDGSAITEFIHLLDIQKAFTVALPWISQGSKDLQGVEQGPMKDVFCRKTKISLLPHGWRILEDWRTRRPHQSRLCHNNPSRAFTVALPWISQGSKDLQGVEQGPMKDEDKDFPAPPWLEDPGRLANQEASPEQALPQQPKQEPPRGPGRQEN